MERSVTAGLCHADQVIDTLPMSYSECCMCLSAGDFDHCHLPIIMERRAHILLLASWWLSIYRLSGPRSGWSDLFTPLLLRPWLPPISIHPGWWLFGWLVTWQFQRKRMSIDHACMLATSFWSHPYVLFNSTRDARRNLRESSQLSNYSPQLIYPHAPDILRAWYPGLKKWGACDFRAEKKERQVYLYKKRGRQPAEGW